MKSIRVRWVPAALLLLPVLEIVVIVAVGQSLGWLVTLAALVVLSTIGFILVRHTGQQAWSQLAQSHSVGTEPTHDVADRAMLFAGGLILILPGFVSDLAALVLLLPFTRPLVRRRVQAWAVRKGAMTVAYGAAPGPTPSRHGSTTPHGPDVVHGEVIDEP